MKKKKKYFYVCEICGMQSEKKEDIEQCEAAHRSIQSEVFWKNKLGKAGEKYYDTIHTMSWINGCSFDDMVEYFVKEGIDHREREYNQIQGELNL